MRSSFSTPAEAVAALQGQATELLAGRQRVRALEAGAGKRTRLGLPEDAYIVGVDTDAAALAHNEQLASECFATSPLTRQPRAPFDDVTSLYVLEHVDDPRVILDLFARWVAPGGLIAIAVPNLISPKALITKFTPHKFHIWFRWRVLGFPNAGKLGYGPYPPRCDGR
jgi:SAM-dependent methyltransferase